MERHASSGYYGIECVFSSVVLALPSSPKAFCGALVDRVTKMDHGFQEPLKQQEISSIRTP